jgi:hypothetical protein
MSEANLRKPLGALLTFLRRTAGVWLAIFKWAATEGKGETSEKKRRGDEMAGQEEGGGSKTKPVTARCQGHASSRETEARLVNSHAAKCELELLEHCRATGQRTAIGDAIAFLQVPWQRAAVQVLHSRRLARRAQPPKSVDPEPPSDLSGDCRFRR